MSNSRVADNYAAWSLCAGDFPAQGAIREKLRFFARFGVLAPSVHNSQPWLISVSDGGVRIAPDAARALPVADPDGAYRRMSLGMCAENIAIAARWFGFAVATRFEADGTVHFNIGPGAVPEQDISPDTIVARLSDKRPYLDREAPASVLHEIADSVSAADATVHFVTTAAGKRAVIDAHHRAIDITTSNSAFVRELSSQLRANTTQQMRGMPGFVADIATLPSIIVPPLLQVYPPLLRKLVADEADRVVAHSAGFGMILSDVHTPDGDVNVGRAYQRVALLLRGAGMVDAMITAAVSFDDIRLHLQRALGLGREIRLLFRFGYARPGARRHTPREPLTT